MTIKATPQKVLIDKDGKERVIDLSAEEAARIKQEEDELVRQQKRAQEKEDKPDTPPETPELLEILEEEDDEGRESPLRKKKGRREEQ